MAVENETAEQVVRMVLQGSEVVLRLSGEAALNVAKMIYAALQGDLTTKGKARCLALSHVNVKELADREYERRIEKNCDVRRIASRV